MRTLVTGGAGFIGAHVVRRLVREGRNVLVVDDFSKGTRDSLRDLDGRVDIRELDLRHGDLPSGLFQDVATVFHLAARVGSVQYLHGTEEAELVALQHNILIDANVFKACEDYGVPTVVYASSVSVYPLDTQKNDGVILREDAVTSYSPDGGYGWAKLVGEIQLQWMNGHRIGIARIFNVYGEGEQPEENAHVIPSLIRKALLHPRVPFHVWGDGRQSRDLLYVEDVVDGLLRLEAAASSPATIVNLGSGTTVEIRTLVAKIVEIAGKGIMPLYDVSQLVGPRSRTADISRARHLLGWEPKVNLDTGLQRTYAWIEEVFREASAR